jgi:hypothetical protein
MPPTLRPNGSTVQLSVLLQADALFNMMRQTMPKNARKQRAFNLCGACMVNGLRVTQPLKGTSVMTNPSHCQQHPAGPLKQSQVSGKWHTAATKPPTTHGPCIYNIFAKFQQQRVPHSRRPPTPPTTRALRKQLLVFEWRCKFKAQFTSIPANFQVRKRPYWHTANGHTSCCKRHAF